MYYVYSEVSYKNGTRRHRWWRGFTVHTTSLDLFAHLVGKLDPFQRQK